MLHAMKAYSYGGMEHKMEVSDEPKDVAWPSNESGRFAVEKRHLILLGVRPAFITYSARRAGTSVVVTTVTMIAIIVTG